jgi:exopolysaccharide biosynthesis polyprenyl glycosylphosphotransferase
VYYRQHRKTRVLFAIADTLLLMLAFFAAYQIRAALPLARNFELDAPQIGLLLGLSFVSWIFVGYWHEIYDRTDSANPKQILADTLHQSAMGGVGLVLGIYLLRLDLSRPFLLFYLALACVLVTVFRLNAGTLVGAIRKEFTQPYYVLIAGTGERALKIGQAIEGGRSHGLVLQGFLDPAPAADSLALERAYPVWPIQRLPDLLRASVIDEVVFAVPSEQLASLEDVFLACDEEGVRTRVAVDFFPHVNSQVYLDRLSEVPLLTFSAAPHDEVKLFLKRTIDVVCSGAALMALSPLLLALALLVKLTSRGPVFFSQERCGLSGRRFTVHKFRSMVADAEERKAELAHLNTKQTAFKIPNDPRLTPVGKWLRKFSLDELPQLWNVFTGDMSLVGPRPAVPNEVERYENWQRRRLRMRPGLTCLWAINGRDKLDFETWMRMDMQYIDTWSLWLDWQIIVRTIPQVLLGKGAH